MWTGLRHNAVYTTNGESANARRHTSASPVARRRRRTGMEPGSVKWRYLTFVGQAGRAPLTLLQAIDEPT